MSSRPTGCIRRSRLVMLLTLVGGLSVVPGGRAAAGPVPPQVTGSLPMRVWRLEDERAGPVNWAVVVHPVTGFVYAANQSGVLEFDGVRWRLMPLPRGGAARSLAIAPDGRVWAAGAAQICVLEPGPGGELQLVDVGVRLPENPPPAVKVNPGVEPVRDEDPETPVPDTRLIGAAPLAIAGSDGVYFVLPRRIVRFRPDDGLDAWRKPAETTVLGWWSDGALHVVPDTGGIARLEAGEFKPLSSTGGPRVLASGPHPAGGWLWLTPSGPLHVQAGRRRAVVSPEATELFRTDRPRCALVLPDGGSLFGTINHGLVVLDAAGKIAQIIDRARGLPANRVNGIAVDGEGGLWLAMHTGLVRVQRDTPFALHGAAQGLMGGPRRIDRVGDQLYVTHTEGIARRDDADGKFREVPGVNAAMHQLAVAGPEVLFAGLGLFSLRADGAAVAQSNRIFRYGVTLPPTRPGTAFVYGAFDVQYWRRGPENATDGPRWRLHGTLAGLPLGADEVYDDGHGFLWFVTREVRVGRVDLRDGLRADAPVETYGPAQGLPALARTDRVRLLPVGGELSVTSNRGHFRFDRVANRFGPESRLPAGEVGPAVVAPTATGAMLWYDRPQPRLRTITPGAGGAWETTDQPMPELGGLAPLGLFADERAHALWIAAEGQLVSFDANWRAGTPSPLRAVVRHVRTLAGGLLWHQPAYAAPGGAQGPFELAADQRSVRVEFTANAYQADLRGRPPLRFRTRVEGLDSEWTAWSDDPYRDLTNLPDGPLALELQASDLAGRESATARLAFTVRPRWWRTPVARLGWCVLAVAAVVGFVRLRTRALHRRAAHLEGVVAERTEELRVRNLELARLHRLEMDEKISARLAEEKAHLELLRYQLNPHFLLNAFTTLRSLVFSAPEAAGEMVGRLAAFTRLALTRSDEAGATVAEEAELVETYLVTEQARWRDTLKCAIAVDPAVRTRRLPPFLLQPLVENAVKYGGRTSPDLLEVRMSIADDGAGGLRIEISNTGTWVEPDAARGTGDSTGIGLENLRQRLRRYYRDAHTLDFAHANGWVRVQLHLRGTAS